MIERYLLDLSAQLAFYGVGRRRAARAVAEARDHLLDLAAEHGDEAAVEHFGSTGTVAAGIARSIRPQVILRSALVFLAALVLFVLPLYGIPENTLPPAPWDERPQHLTWKLQAATGAFAVAVGLAALGVFAAWRRRLRTTLVSLGLSGGALAVGASFALIGAVQWAEAVPGSGLTLALTSLSTAAIVATAVTALAVAFRSGARLDVVR